MTVNVSLLTSSDVLDRLTTVTDGRGSVVRISRQELTDLLLDWSVMHSALSRSSTFKVTEPEHRERPRLST